MEGKHFMITGKTKPTDFMMDLGAIITPHPANGVLSIVESAIKIPFLIQRVYYIYGASAGITRGHHAHKTLTQLLICVNGEIEIALDDGKNSTKYLLNNPSKGLLVLPGQWRTMKWIKDDSVLLVLASEHYDEKDYIRNYDDFLKWTHERSSIQ